MLFILCSAETSGSGILLAHSGADRSSRMASHIQFNSNPECVNGLSSAGPFIGGAVAAARAVPRDFIGVIAWVSGVTVRALYTAILDPLVTAIPNYRIVVATPEIR